MRIINNHSDRVRDVDDDLGRELCDGDEWTHLKDEPTNLSQLVTLYLKQGCQHTHRSGLGSCFPGRLINAPYGAVEACVPCSIWKVLQTEPLVGGLTGSPESIVRALAAVDFNHWSALGLSDVTAAAEAWVEAHPVPPDPEVEHYTSSGNSQCHYFHTERQARLDQETFGYSTIGDTWEYGLAVVTVVEPPELMDERFSTRRPITFEEMKARAGVFEEWWLFDLRDVGGPILGWPDPGPSAPHNRGLYLRFFTQDPVDTPVVLSTIVEWLRDAGAMEPPEVILTKLDEPEPWRG